jgi:hypothetical protein
LIAGRIRLKQKACSTVSFLILWQGGFMKDRKSGLQVEVEYPAPELTSEQLIDLKKRLENTLVHFFPSLVKEEQVSIIVRPQMPGDHH